jgi:hypothetical protein
LVAEGLTVAKAFSSSAARVLRTASGRADSRTSMVKAVRAACRRLRMDDDDRHALQREVTGKRSMSDMTLAELGKLLDRLNRDWKGPMGHRAHVGKIRALWWSLYWLGAVDRPDDEALGAFVARQTGKARLQFLGSKEAFRVIEALKAMAARAGVRWATEERLAALAPAHPHLTLALLDRHAVAAAIGDKLGDARLIKDWAWWCEAALGLGRERYAWSEKELDACIRALGKRLRRHLDKSVDE